MVDSLLIFCSMATAIVLEAAPFLLLGSLVGALFEVFVPDRALERFIPRNVAAQVMVGLVAGMALPTCECGVVPIARRLLLRRVPVRMVMAYMLAAPVINPVVLLSTYVAFQSDLSMVGLRVLFVAVPAAAVAFGLGRGQAHDVLRMPKPVLLRMHGIGEPAIHAHEAHDHGHTHEHGCSCAACAEGAQQGSRFMAVLSHTSLEFLSMARFLIVGACLAAAFKVFVPAGVLRVFAGSPVLSIASMMLFAVLSSVCSEADAFVAAGFSMLPRVAQLSFTAIGPMVDLKLMGMFAATFRGRVTFALVLIPLISVFGMSLLLHWLGGGL
jgi:uncharacterized protein